MDPIKIGGVQSPPRKKTSYKCMVWSNFFLAESSSISFLLEGPFLVHEQVQHFRLLTATVLLCLCEAPVVVKGLGRLLEKKRTRLTERNPRSVLASL